MTSGSRTEPKPEPGHEYQEQRAPGWRRWMDKHPGLTGAVAGGVASCVVSLIWKAIEKWLLP